MLELVTARLPAFGLEGELHIQLTRLSLPLCKT